MFIPVYCDASVLCILPVTCQCNKIEIYKIPVTRYNDQLWCIDNIIWCVYHQIAHCIWYGF